MSAHTASAAYARQNGKPVVCVWGFGFNDANHPWDPSTCLDVVNWFKAQGCYVIGGGPREGRTRVRGSPPRLPPGYHPLRKLPPRGGGASRNNPPAPRAHPKPNPPGPPPPPAPPRPHPARP